LLAAAAQASEGATVPLADHGIAARCAQAAYGLLFYPWKTLVPTGLSTLYLLEDRLDPTRPLYLACLLGVAGITLALVLSRRRFPAGLAAWAAYALLVSPVLGFLQSGQQKVADRYGYLALLPLFGLLAGGVFGLLRVPRARRAGIVAIVAWIVLLGGASWRQTLQWRDSLTLWTQAARLEPGNYIAQLNVAAALRELGRRDEALQRARLSIAANPGPRNVYARFYVGLLFLEEGDFEAALSAWREALAVDPADLTTLQVVSAELARRGRAEEGLAWLEAGVAAAAGDVELRGLLAEALWRSGERNRAEQVWREGLAVQARWVAGHAGLARALLARGQASEAEEHLRSALGVDPEHAESLLLLGRVLRARGQVQDAEALWRRVLARDPRNAEAQALLRQSRDAGAQGR
jgi:tetratricopeptide (TPR) repeat protein